MRLSIVTINYNNLAGLQKTVDSILHQTLTDYEWIVIDGCSTDGSREYLEQYQSHYAYWCSEPDKGIYNAINKGLSHAKGEYVQFLNSGDWLYDRLTLEKAFEQINGQSDIYYGDMMQVNGNENPNDNDDRKHNLNPIVYPDELGFLFFPYNNICHQAAFYRRSLFDGNPYDESFSIVSDWAMNLNLLFKGATFKHLNQFIVYYDNCGRSSAADQRHHEERTAAFEKYVPEQVRIDVKKYEKKYYFLRRRKSTRWIIDHAISFSQWIDKLLTRKEYRHIQ